MNAQFVYAKAKKILTILNQFVSEGFQTNSNKVHTEDTNGNVGLGISIDHLEVRKAMLEADMIKAKALNMIRLRESLR